MTRIFLIHELTNFPHTLGKINKDSNVTNYVEISYGYIQPKFKNILIRKKNLCQDFEMRTAEQILNYGNSLEN